MSETSEKSFRPESLEAFGRMLRQRRKERALSLDALAQLTGISKPYLANIETARTPGPPSAGKLRLLEKALGFGEGELLSAADWLRTPASVRSLFSARTPRRPDGAIDLDALLRRSGGAGGAEQGPEGSQRGPGDGPGEQEQGAFGPPGAIRVAPIINRVAAGRAAEYSDLGYPAGVADAYAPIPAEVPPDFPPEESAAWKSAFVCRVFGDSMEPEFTEGDLVVVAPLEARDGEDCLVRLGEADNFATTLKRVYFVPDHSGQAQSIRLSPRNSRHSERTVSLSEVTGIYPVVYRMRQVRRGS